MQLSTSHKAFSILNSILRDGSKKAGLRFGAKHRILVLVPETGLEPVRGCPQRFLRP